MVSFRSLSDCAYDVNLGLLYELPHLFEADPSVCACDHKHCLRVCWQQLRNLADVTVHPNELTRPCLLAGSQALRLQLVLLGPRGDCADPLVVA